MLREGLSSVFANCYVESRTSTTLGWAGLDTTVAAKIISKLSLQKEWFGGIKFVQTTQQSLYYNAQFLTCCSLANGDIPVAATLQSKLAIITKNTTKQEFPRKSFVILSARMACVEAV